MTSLSPLQGVFAAAVTPLHEDFSIAPAALPGLLDFYARRGCHGALICGTTGEGPSFAADERRSLWRAALDVRLAHPSFQLFAGVGTPSLEETIALTRAAFDLGFDAAVALPPYYFRKVNDDGLFQWFSLLIRRALPSDGRLLGYHIPNVSGVGFSLDLLARLKDAFPAQFTGIKDSSGDPEWAAQLGARFGRDLAVFTGSDRLFGHALQQRAAGCITALANLYAPLLRRVWDAWQSGGEDSAAQGALNALRAVLDRYPPAAPLLKEMLARQHNLPHWPPRPPLLPIAPAAAAQAQREFEACESGAPGAHA